MSAHGLRFSLELSTAALNLDAQFPVDESEHLKCPCQACGGFIEFPAQGIGLAVECPHCQQTTTLVAADEAENASIEQIETPAPAPASRQPKRRLVWIVLLLLFGAVIAAALFIYQDHWSTPKSSAEKSPIAETPASNAAPASPAPAARNAKSIDDLKAGPITLEKTKGSSLVHAVGILRNDSDHQRFGVTIELEMSDAGGNPAGKARDYKDVLEPRQSWRFRALVLDSKAVSAKVATIREEE